MAFSSNVVQCFEPGRLPEPTRSVHTLVSTPQKRYHYNMKDTLPAPVKMFLSLFLLIKPFRNWLEYRNEQEQLRIDREVDRLHK